MMSKKDLWRQVQERSEANTTHLTNGTEAVRTIMDGYRSGNLEEDEYERLLFALHRAFFAEANEGSKFFFFFFFFFFEENEQQSFFNRSPIIPTQTNSIAAQSYSPCCALKKRYNASGRLGPLRQAFILFNHVSGYTAGFGRFWMSARRLKSVYSVV
jgi:hypothetical protein